MERQLALAIVALVKYECAMHGQLLKSTDESVRKAAEEHAGLLAEANKALGPLAHAFAITL